MAYSVTRTDGTRLVTVEDGTKNQQYSVSFIGKGLDAYGTLLNNNFLRLLENSSSATPPASPILGQLWYDTTKSLLKVCKGENPVVWSAVGSAIEAVVDLGSVSSAAVIDRAVGNIFKLTATNNFTLVINNITAGQTATIIIAQDSTGSRLWGYPSTFRFLGGVGTLSTAANAVDKIDVMYDGTVHYVNITKGFVAVTSPALSTIVSATGNNGESTIIVSSAAGLAVGQTVAGTCIGAGAVITSIVGTTITLSVPNTCPVNGNVIFTTPPVTTTTTTTTPAPTTTTTTTTTTAAPGATTTTTTPATTTTTTTTTTPVPTTTTTTTTPIPAPVINSFTITPNTILADGTATSTIAWNTSGGYANDPVSHPNDPVRLSIGGGTPITGLAASGTQVIGPYTGSGGSVSLVLEVVGLGGTTLQLKTLVVNAVTTTTPATTTTTTTTTTAAPGAPVSTLGFNGNNYYWNKSSSGPSSITLKFQSNGTWSLVKTSSGSPFFAINGSPLSWSDPVGGNWFAPTTTNIGTGYLIKFTSNDYNFAGGGSTTLSGGDSGWLVLDQDRTQQVSVTAGGGDAIYVSWRVDIAVNNSGSPGATVATGVIEFDGSHA